MPLDSETLKQIYDMGSAHLFNEGKGNNDNPSKLDEAQQLSLLRAVTDATCRQHGPQQRPLLTLTVEGS